MGARFAFGLVKQGCWHSTRDTLGCVGSLRQTSQSASGWQEMRPTRNRMGEAASKIKLASKIAIGLQSVRTIPTAVPATAFFSRVMHVDVSASGCRTIDSSDV